MEDGLTEAPARHAKDGDVTHDRESISVRRADSRARRRDAAPGVTSVSTITRTRRSIFTNCHCPISFISREKSSRTWKSSTPGYCPSSSSWIMTAWPPKWRRRLPQDQHPQCPALTCSHARVLPFCCQLRCTSGQRIRAIRCPNLAAEHSSRAPRAQANDCVCSIARDRKPRCSASFRLARIATCFKRYASSKGLKFLRSQSQTPAHRGQKLSVHLPQRGVQRFVKEVRRHVVIVAYMSCARQSHGLPLLPINRVDLSSVAALQVPGKEIPMDPERRIAASRSKPPRSKRRQCGTH